MFKMSSLNHEIDGQTEQTNRTLEDMLRMYVGKKQHSWNKLLYMVEFAYNDHFHNIIRVSPFYILYSQEYKTLLLILDSKALMIGLER